LHCGRPDRQRIGTKRTRRRSSRGLGPCAGCIVRAAGTAESGKPEPGEPVVRLTIIDDDNVRIEELKVRGRSQRIVVTPKNGSKPYEIITDNGSRDLSEGPNGFNGAVGKRVWPVLSF
jgi:hypothetical protein